MGEPDRVVPFRLVHDIGHHLTPAERDMAQALIDYWRSVLDDMQRKLADERIAAHDDRKWDVIGE
jgi:hypothetical protein